MASIFLSYARENRSCAEKLAATLESAGHSVWWDRHLDGGEEFSAEIEAARLGVERGIPDLHLSIYDEDGKELVAADDSALHVQDPVVSIVAERDGAYFVEVRHTMYNGGGDLYRVHIGTFARPTGIYPSGGPAGAETKVRVLGDPTGSWEQAVRAPATPGDVPFVAVNQDGTPAASPNRFRVSPFPNVLEAEPNDAPESLSASAAELPVEPGETGGDSGEGEE